MADSSIPRPGPVSLTRSLTRSWRRMVEEVDHLEVLRAIREDGELSGRYVFMVVAAAGIATIGLLLNSPAVIIGAMLISPLMGPIALTGAGIATVSEPRFRAGMVGLVVGCVLAILTAAVIVALSPIQESTPEILARARPNLFDLIVAVLSGLAGGYATVRGKGGAVVGVAIATALMPPLAVLAFGLVLEQWLVARGAALLFITNIVAIGLSIALMMSWYGFARRVTRSDLMWRTVLSGLLLAPLAYPLTLSLLAIVDETGFAQEARRQTEAHLGAGARIESLRVSFSAEGRAHVDGVALVRHPVEALDVRLAEALSATQGRQVSVSVAQVPVADPSGPRAAPSAVANPVRLSAPKPEALPPLEGFPVALARRGVDLARRTVLLEPDPSADLPLAALRRMEAEWQAAHPDWKLTLRPPLGPLPSVNFALRSAELDEAAQASLADASWAARAWGVQRLRVQGYASTAGGGTAALARRRAEAVAAGLEKAGFTVEVASAYPVPEQRKLEKTLGTRHFQRTDIGPLLP